jgi:hypothetical protein
VQGALYRLYNGNSMTAGENLELTITGKMVGQDLNNTTGALVGLGALGVSLVFAGVWLYRRKAASVADDDRDIEEDKRISEETPESIMDAILTLDDLFQANELPEEAYLRRRNELKERLRKVLDLDQAS